MPVLTIEAIRRNPWNAVEQPLPRIPNFFFLRMAWCAAHFCCLSEHEFMLAAQRGEFPLHGPHGEDIHAEAEEEAAARCYRASQRLAAIDAICRDTFGEVPDFLC